MDNLYAIPDNCGTCNMPLQDVWQAILSKTSFQQYWCKDCMQKQVDRFEELRQVNILVPGWFTPAMNELRGLGVNMVPKKPIFQIVVGDNINFAILDGKSYYTCKDVLSRLSDNFTGIAYSSLIIKDSEIVVSVLYKEPIIPQSMFQLKICTGPIYINLYSDDKDNAITMANILFEDFDGAKSIEVFEKSTGEKVFDRKR